MAEQDGNEAMPFWKGLFEWSMKYQEAGSSYQQGQALSEADKEWLEDALKNAMVDLGKRMVDIKEALDGEECSSIQEKETMLDELQDLVESIDQAKDLSTIGGLSTLLNVMDSKSLHCILTKVISDDGHDPDVQAAALEVTKVLGMHGICVPTHKSEIIQGVELYLARMDVCPEEDWGAAEDGVAAAKDVLALLKRETVDSRDAQEMRLIIR
eukprot:jgi/Picre1/30624/NNA_005985.t1